jgi:proliferating cell nuclear antigen
VISKDIKTFELLIKMGYKFELKTVQVSVIKGLVEALREIITETNIEISPKGIRISATDPSVTILVHLLLEADNFEYYNCDETIIIGVNIINLFKLTRTFVNSDSLTFYIDEEKTSKLGIRVENEELNKVTEYQLNLIDIDEDVIDAPDTNFVTMITMPSCEFQKVCRESHNIADVIEIKSMGEQLILSCQGDFASQETTYANTQSGVIFSHDESKDNEEIIQGYYLLRHLALFSKCSNMCTSIKMFLENEKPLIIQYSVGTLGNLLLVLAPQIED